MAKKENNLSQLSSDLEKCAVLMTENNLKDSSKLGIPVAVQNTTQEFRLKAIRLAKSKSGSGYFVLDTDNQYQTKHPTEDRLYSMSELSQGGWCPSLPTEYKNFLKGKEVIKVTYNATGIVDVTA